MVHEEAKCEAVVLTLGPWVCVMHMAVQTYSVQLNVDLEHSSVMVNINLFVQYNSAFLVLKS